MAAQISPGELGSVFYALKFAEDLVIKWLINYKFKNWTVTESRKLPVTKEYKRKRAEEIAKELINHSKWRSHGRSIKIGNLEEIGLKIIKVDNDPKLSDIVYRIQTVCRLIFESTTSFKIFATQDNKIFRHAVKVGTPIRIPGKPKGDVVEIEQRCEKCGEVHKIYAKLAPDPKIDVKYKNKGFMPFQKDAKIICKCGFEIDLLGIKNQIEIKMGKKVLV